MAICRADYELLKRIGQDKQVPRGSTLLEIGEAEYYGDVPFQEFMRDVKAHGSQGSFLEVVDLIHRAKRGDSSGAAWGLAKIVYQTFLGVDRITSIDLHGSDAAIKRNLNYAAEPAEKFDVVYNCGTAEHVFRAGNVLEFIHDATRAGGLMMHCFPLTGLIDHGFWTINPVLIFCLCQANLYELLYITLSVIEGELRWLDPSTARKDIRAMAQEGRLPHNAWLHVVYRKSGDTGFVLPSQEIYSACPDPEVVEAWRSMR